ncbi:MAG: MotA/TolQ/ExbB proton channel family protein [Burkholderiales bacterium]|nr:MotA/TolQ/ExbB proton channel family protein [Burkholderiales bacterium]
MKTRFSAFLAAAILTLGTAAVAPAFADDAASASAAASAPVASAAAATPAPAAEAPAANPADITAAAPAKEVIENPYGLDALWKTGDFVAKGTLIIMFIMSMGSWYILITKIIDQFKLGGQAKDARNKFWKAASVQAGAASLKEGSPFRFIADSGIKATEHHEGALLEQIDLNTWVSMSIQRAVDKVQSRLQDGLAFLATVGSTAPFVGLFGTVWGIYHALTAIGMSGQASIDKVAGPVGEALIMTAIGLAVAVPAVLGYNFLVRRNKSSMEEVRAFSADLHSVVLSGSMSKTAAKKAA